MSAKKILITRPETDAAELAQNLKKCGLHPIILPMMHIEFTTEKPHFDSHVNRLIFTSANGVRAFAHHIPPPHPAFHLPAYAVGEKSAAVAREYGFRTVLTANGNSDELYKLIIADAPKDAYLYHAAASNHPHHLAERLRESGFQIYRDILYQTIARESLPHDFLDLLPDLTAIMLFSPRTAAIFLQLLQKLYWQKGCIYTINFVCLSVQIYATVEKHLADMPIASNHVRTAIAASPNEAMMLEALNDFL